MHVSEFFLHKFVWFSVDMRFIARLVDVGYFLNYVCKAAGETGNLYGQQIIKKFTNCFHLAFVKFH